MEIQLDKRYPVAARRTQAWAVLGDVHATAACMPGASITEQLDETHFKGQVRSRIGPASLVFDGQIERLACDPVAQRIELLAKGADKSGSSASMKLSAHLEDAGEGCVLVGQATVTVSGKLAQFGNRLLVPASDALLAQFAQHFNTAAAAVAVDTAQPDAAAPAAVPVAAQPLNALALAWATLKAWLRSLFRRE